MKKIIAYINAEGEFPENVVKLADSYACKGADELFVYNYSGDEETRQEFLSILKQVGKTIDIPFLAGMYVERFEDAKKVLYTGASKLVIRKALMPTDEEFSHIVSRFGKDSLMLEIDMKADFQHSEQLDAFYEKGYGSILLKHIDMTKKYMDVISEAKADVYVRDSLERNDLEDELSLTKVLGVMTNYFEEKEIYKAKRSLKEKGIDTEVFESAIPFSRFKLMDNGLIPVVTQDYLTNEVLMVAYMNEESYQKTIETGKMTYFSRSRQELWCKGDTSGHYQYVKVLKIDCDNDTILAKVRQIGAACHTGNYSCFFRDLTKKTFRDMNYFHILEEDYKVIADRKWNPKEGSYTNYLFDKGIDKILKKCGEEASEIIIAAKNQDKEELVYEIADFMYHVMVLMAQKDIDWEDIMKELVNRRSK